MLPADIGIPSAPTALGVLALVIVIAYKLISDRRAVMSEIGTLRGQVTTLDRKLTALEVQYDEQRGLKHKANNDVARCVLALDLTQRLVRDCSCGALGPLVEIIDRLFAELETLAHPAAD